MHLIITDWINGRHIQQSVLLYNLWLSISLEHMPICIPFHWLVVGASPILYRAQTKGGDRKYKKGEAKRECGSHSFGVGLLPCLRSVSIIENLSAWVELSCNLSVVKRFGLLLQIFVAMRQELRKRNTLTWPYYCKKIITN